jgi:hypothetical protein
MQPDYGDLRLNAGIVLERSTSLPGLRRQTCMLVSLASIEVVSEFLTGVKARPHLRTISGIHMVNQFSVEFELVTPAFCGGANNENGPAEIRLPLILGQLGWWWRALAWGCTSGSGTELERLKTIHEWEQTLFGSADTGTGAFTARLMNPPLSQSVTSRKPVDHIGGYSWDALTNGQRSKRTGQEGLGYLSGQGLADRDQTLIESAGGNRMTIPKKRNNGQPLAASRSFDGRWARNEKKDHLQGPRDKRPALPPSSRFSIEFRARRGADLSKPIAANAPTLKEAIDALGLLGGIGARWRRGFGSLMLTGAPEFASVEKYREAVEAVLRPNPSDDLAPYSAVGGPSAFRLVTKPGEKLVELHSRMGVEFQKFRTNWHKTPGSRFWADHEWFYLVSDPKHFQQDDPIKPGQKIDAPYPDDATLATAGACWQPERMIYGLPHNYYSRNPKYIPSPRKVDLNAQADSDGKDARRASPLFLHFHIIGGEPVAVWYRLNSCFLPPDAELVITPEAGGFKTREKPWTITHRNPSFAPIDCFLKS